MSTATAIKTVKLNEEVVREMNLQTFPSVKAKDLFVKTVLKYVDLLPCEVDALLAISRFATKVPGVCWATVATMVADKNTKYGDRAFRKGVAGLRDKEIIIVHETRRIRSGGKGTNIYQLNPDVITKFVPNSSVHIDDSDRVHIADSYRPDGEIPCGTSDETLSREPKKSFKVLSKSLSKDINKSYSYKDADAEEPQNQDCQVEEKAIKEEPKLGDFYNHEIDKYCLAFGVPAEVIKELKPYFRSAEVLDASAEIIKVWKSIKGGLRNVGQKYEDNVDEVIQAIIYAVMKYKQKEVKVSFSACLVGKLKGLIADREKSLAEEYEKQARQERMAMLRKFYGLDADEENTEEEETEQESEEKAVSSALSDRVRVLYKRATIIRRMSHDEAVEAVVEELCVSDNMKPWDARCLVSSVVGVSSAPEEVWGSEDYSFDQY